MSDVFITGIGHVTCLGYERDNVLGRLREMRHGFTKNCFLKSLDLPVQVGDPVIGFECDDANPAQWIFPERHSMDCRDMRAWPPHGLYARAAMQDAMKEAGLEPHALQDGRTGLYCASAGSPFLTYYYFYFVTAQD